MMMEFDSDDHDEPWTDGHRAHPACGRFVEEHRLVYKKQPDGTSRSYWECPIQTLS
jgi:hypothetical protein